MSRARPDATQRTLALISIVIVAVNALSVVLDPRDHEYLPLLAIDSAHGALAAVVAVIAARARRPWSTLRSDVLFVVVSAPFLVGLWLPQSYDASRGSLIDPLLAHRFLLLGIAVSAPSWRSGGGMIALTTAHGVVLWHVLLGRVHTPALDREPWFTVFFAAIAGMLLYTRARRRDLEQRLAATEARADTLVHVNRVLLALRDRANTPLQTLEIAIAMLEKEPGRHEALLTLMRRALVRLVTIQQTLASSGGVVDLDAPLDLEAELQQLMADRESKP